MDSKDIAELHQQLDGLYNKRFELAQHAVRFAQNWYLVANAGGVTASIGYLGTHTPEGPEFFAGLVTLTIFMIGFGVSLHSATLHARLLSKYATDTWQWGHRVKIERRAIDDEPELDATSLDRIATLGKIGYACIYLGAGIGLVSLWVGQI